MIRLFIGLELPPSVKADLAVLRGGVDGARWQRDDQLHLTIRFIGEVDTHSAEDIREALEPIDFHPFSMRLQGIGLFGTPKSPRLLWAGVDDPHSLKHLHEKVDNALERIAIPPEQRKFTPHVTIARFRGRSGRVGRHIAAHQHFTSETFTINHFSLFRSRLGSEGARYEVIERYSAYSAHNGRGSIPELNKGMFDLSDIPPTE